MKDPCCDTVRRPLVITLRGGGRERALVFTVRGGREWPLVITGRGGRQRPLVITGRGVVEAEDRGQTASSYHRERCGGGRGQTAPSSTGEQDGVSEAGASYHTS